MKGLRQRAVRTERGKPGSRVETERASLRLRLGRAKGGKRALLAWGTEHPCREWDGKREDRLQNLAQTGWTRCWLLEPGRLITDTLLLSGRSLMSCRKQLVPVIGENRNSSFFFLRSCNFRLIRFRRFVFWMIGGRFWVVDRFRRSARWLGNWAKFGRR